LTIEIGKLCFGIEWMLSRQANHPWVSRNPFVWGSSDQWTVSVWLASTDVNTGNSLVLGVNGANDLVCGHGWGLDCIWKHARLQAKLGRTVGFQRL
jgi:hypothetical protein